MPLVQNDWWQQAEEHGKNVLKHIEQISEGASRTAEQCSHSLCGPSSIVDMHLQMKTTTISLTRPRPSNNRNSAQCIRTLDGHAWLTSQCSNSMLIESDAKAVLMSELFAHIFRLDDLAVHANL
jgi:hypothetical protein